MAQPQPAADPRPSPGPRRRRPRPADTRSARPAPDPQQQALARLRAPFPPAEVSQRPEITCDACRAARYRVCPRHERTHCGTCNALLTAAHTHLDYVGHAAATARLLDVDPLWDWEPLAYTEDGLPRIDRFGGLWIRLTVCGISRLGYGDATGRPAGTRAVKELVGDAIRNAGMRFGMALNLWAGAAPRYQEEPSPGDILAARLGDDPRLWRSVRGLTRLRTEAQEQGLLGHVVAEYDWRALGEIVDTQIELLSAPPAAAARPAAPDPRALPPSLRPLPTPAAGAPSSGPGSPGGAEDALAAFLARMRNGWWQLEPTRMALAEAKAKALLDETVPHPANPQQHGRVEDLLTDQIQLLTDRRQALQEEA
ncbi:hypothetical protein ACIGZJ_30755 [Kitasatospora sp. NPDC052868]|uniref:hypothetical protein n=1 Tax=Kitasatospora sp. NPDC052868 TaxID=3364060 RepID=UPI0037CAC9C5